MKEMQSAYSTYEKVHDMLVELEYLFDDIYDTSRDAITADEEDTLYKNRLENWTVTVDVKLDELASAVEGLKIVRNKFNDLLTTAISELKVDRAKLEVFKHIVDVLR